MSPSLLAHARAHVPVRGGRARSTAVLTASLVALALLVPTTSARAGSADDDNPCARVRHDPGGVKILATADGQVLTGTDVGDVLDANGHLDVTVNGLGGDDDICGGPGEDVLNGGDGGDWIQGGAGDDVVHGDAGDDYLFGNAGNDEIFGDSGRDSVSVGNGPYGDPSGPSDDDDTADGGEGRDYLDIGAKLEKSAPMTIDAGAGTAIVPRGMSVLFSGFESYSGPGRRATFLGTSADEVLLGGVDLALMGGGNDTVYTGPGSDVYGGSGDDDIEMFDGGSAHGGSGNDLVHLSFEPYSLPHPVTRFGGGAGDDTFTIESYFNDGREWDPDAVDAHFAGGPGTDFIDLKLLEFPVHADLGERVAHWRNSRFVWTHVERFRGSARGDRIRGSRGPDVISGYDGPDVMYGLRGPDVLGGGTGRDVVWGGPGHDVCHAEVRHLCEAR